MTIFVAGGTGKTGGRVAARLQERGIAVRAGSRRTGFDWARPESFAPAIGDADRAYVTYYPDMAVPSAVPDLAAFGRVAVERGVERIVLLSGRGEPEAVEAEDALRKAGIPTTVLRAAWMNQNFSEGGFAEMVRAGHVTLPAGDVGEPFVDCDDIADAAVAALLEPAGDLYELTGPRLLTFAEAASELGAAYTRITLDEFTGALPPEYADLLRYLFGTIFDGRNASLGTGVQDLLGREPRDFSLFAQNVRD
ncbi:NmrA family transcriptional regulator [Actinoplanes sp. NPDC051633]|uniref:SDR family oxidoreductase n=1 Tax=Actinoplanes sp. NPDC051633 TaxID=3155670 RepID=UPI003436C9FF